MDVTKKARDSDEISIASCGQHLDPGYRLPDAGFDESWASPRGLACENGFWLNFCAE
ncbi:hypothetical protein OG292_08720 [Streptomyces sp. NBC_01511]|uniref:hypothetical protein n=1 Tax=unclassified Streptomyces TaxID=2593676 RepID=UPI00386A62D7